MTTRISQRALVCVVLVAALVAASCSDDSGSGSPVTTTVVDAETTTTSASPVSTTTTVAPTSTEAPVAQSQVSRTYVDDSRITPAGAETEELLSRIIDVWVDLPPTSEPAPLIIFAHGLTGHPLSHEMHRTDLAANGFVVLAPAFPLTNNDVPGAWQNAGDTENQVGDVSFLIDSILDDPEFAGRIDPNRIGMIGHSLGGLTTAGAAVGLDADTRIQAAVVMSAGFGAPRDDVAVMVLHGDGDAVVPYASSTVSYAQLTERRVLVTLTGGNHLEGIIDDDSELGVDVRGLTAAFFARELGVDGPSIDELSLDRVVIEAGTSEGVLADWRDYFVA